MSETVRVPIEVATDYSMEQQLRAEGSLTQEATKDLITPALAEFPGVVDAAKGAVEGALAGASVMTTTPRTTSVYEVAVGDQDGNITWLQADKAGAPTTDAIAALESKGVPTATPAAGDYEVAVGDADGNPTWLQANANGLPTSDVIDVLHRFLGIHMGPNLPPEPPAGRPAIWFETDGFGNLIDIKGVAL
ncbi:hypothetical protein [Pseudoclavibacter sp. 8L]|uniref:hypothetical protein n=1 Tax=Pseudoclavibacter sp. 8L TaxID=2653162 RepID=UPI0012F19BD0|nr:hypothetical protein [Pseudoclavibacter sp. 8L]VXB32332.1 hypothetical protein PSCLAVI8L_130483 [Pseudoclavibacter sp. 8L]